MKIESNVKIYNLLLLQHECFVMRVKCFVCKNVLQEDMNVVVH